MPISQYGEQSGHCTLEVSHAADQFLRLFAEQIEFLVLVQVGHQRLAVLNVSRAIVCVPSFAQQTASVGIMMLLNLDLSSHKIV